MFLRDFVARCANGYPEKTAFIHRDTRRTWRDMHERSERLAAAMQSLGVRKGHNTAMLARNRIELAEHWFACLKTGIVRTAVNWRYSQREMLHTIRDCDAKLILIESGCMETIAGDLDDLRREGRILVGFGPGHGLEHDYETLLAAHPEAARYPPLVESEIAMIGYTSGTTGLPKGVLISQGALRDSMVHIALYSTYRAEDVRLYVTNPAGINIFQMCFNLVTGMTTVVDDYETKRFLELVEEYKVTAVTLIPTMLTRILEVLKTGHHDVSSLRQIVYGTMPSTAALIRSAYGTLGCEFLQLYGASESVGPVAGLRDPDHKRAISGEPELLTSIGRPMLNADISVRDDEGREVPTGETGTVWIRSDSLMSGYLNLPDETAEALVMSADGSKVEWLRTGDYGRLDGRGYIYLGDRKKHMIISGGMNVFPAGVESALAEHASVAEAVVVGVPHPEWGEAVVAVVSLVSGENATPEELIAHCKSRVAKWETPKYIEIVDELPQGHTHKLDKREVARRLRDSGRLPWNLS